MRHRAYFQMDSWFNGPGSTNKQPFGRGQFRLPRVEGVEGVRLQGECGGQVKYVECSGTQTRRLPSRDLLRPFEGARG